MQVGSRRRGKKFFFSLFGGRTSPIVSFLVRSVLLLGLFPLLNIFCSLFSKVSIRSFEEIVFLDGDGKKGLNELGMFGIFASQWYRGKVLVLSKERGRRGNRTENEGSVWERPGKNLPLSRLVIRSSIDTERAKKEMTVGAFAIILFLR